MPVLAPVSSRAVGKVISLLSKIEIMPLSWDCLKFKLNTQKALWNRAWLIEDWK